MLVELHPKPADPYRVPKTKVAVELALRGRPIERVAVFVSGRGADHDGRERPSDLLLGPDALIPVEVGESRVCLVQKRHVTWMRVPRAAEAHGRLPGDAWGVGDALRRVAITLDDGCTLRGSIVVSRDEARRRVQDSLNESVPFLELHDRTHLTLVNRDRVVAVEDQD